MKPKKIERKSKPQFTDVKRWYDENLHPAACDLDDQDVYENVYHEGRWAGIFQFSEAGAQRFAKRAKPRSIVDIAAITSIYRPGPLTAKVDKAFVRDKEKVEAGEKLEYEHPIIEDVLSKTYGHMVFQEDFMKLGNALGKLSWEDCDKLRKILVKKSIGTDVNDEKARQALEIKQRFKKGAIENGMSDKQVEDLWKKMEFFSGYGFNASLASSTLIDVYDSVGNHTKTSQISDIAVGDHVRSRDEETGDEIFVEVKALHDHGDLDVFEFMFEDGSVIKCTPNHKFRTVCGRMLPIKQIFEEGLDICQHCYQGK